MKKTLWMLGVAVAALTSCTESEVLDVPESRVIDFSSFVENETRNVSQVNKDNIRDFYVIGYRSTDNGNTFTDPVLSSAHVTSANGTVWGYTPAAYWQPNSKYRFAAYANGSNGGELGNLEYNAKDDKIEITDYSVTDKDLIFAISGDKTIGQDIGNPGIVELSFRHMLTIVKFTFINASGNSTLKISNLKVNNIDMTADGLFTYSDKSIAWDIDNTRSETCTYLDEEEFLQVASGNSNSIDHLLIPQDSNGALVSFTVSIIDANGDYHSGFEKNNISLTIPQTGTAPNQSPETTKWLNQYIYNYQISIGEDLKVIAFNVQTVEGWKTDYNDNGNHEDDIIELE